MSPLAASACGQQLDRDRRRAALALELQVDDPRDLAERGDDLVAGRIERVQVVAEDFDRDLRGLAAQALADAIARETSPLRSACPG